MKKVILSALLLITVSNTYADYNKIMIAKNLCQLSEKIAASAQKSRQDNISPSQTTSNLFKFIDNKKHSNFEKESLSRIIFVSVTEAYKYPIYEDVSMQQKAISFFSEDAYTSCINALNAELIKQKY